MLTNLYLITIATWFHLAEFSESAQVNDCLKEKARIEKIFQVKAICLTKGEGQLLLNNRAYQNG